MKKHLRFTLIAAFLFSMTQLASAQIKFGPRLGLNMATWAGVNNNATFKPGLHIGGYVKLGLGEKLAFQPELLFSMKGAKGSGGNDQMSSNYIDIPLLLNIGKSQGMHFLVGVQPSLLLSAKYKAGSNTTDYKDLYNGFDFAPILGLGYQMEGGFNTDLRLSYGIPDIMKNAANSNHNFNLQLTFGYTIGGN